MARRFQLYIAVHLLCLDSWCSLSQAGFCNPSASKTKHSLAKSSYAAIADTAESSRRNNLPPSVITKQTFHDLGIKPSVVNKKRKRAWLSRLLRRTPTETAEKQPDDSVLRFNYEYSQLTLDGAAASKNTTGVVLIHPIGVGISKWFYERLFWALSDRHASVPVLVVAPDLLLSGSATNPTTLDGAPISEMKPPLLNISDWTEQIVHLMAQVEQESNVDRWCVVANGGCSPIALQVAQRSVLQTAPFQQIVTNVILSSVPRLSFFMTRSDPTKVLKSYKMLCGWPGKLFWWYSCRNQGAFIQSFSEKNLVANATNLGPDWRRNCYETAVMNDGLSRYSTFAFLAGTLQDGCVESLNALQNSNVQINIIQGRDTRRNQAKSWFWQKKRKKKKGPLEKRQTFGDFVAENGNGGQEATIGGRISLAHEDAIGYSDAIVSFLTAY